MSVEEEELSFLKSLGMSGGNQIDNVLVGFPDPF
jgi:hypothetical protein